MKRLLTLIAVLAMMAGTLATASAAELAQADPVPPKPGCAYFPETQHNVCAGFLAYWERFGGLETYGFPLTEEFDDNGRVVQLFERARFEWHPGAAPARFDVLLGLLGREVTAGRNDPPFQNTTPNPECTYHPETQHNLCAGFRAYWEQFGGLAVFGHPISEEFEEVNADTGETLRVQYFERQRFEWHPGVNPLRYDVLLGRLGAELLPETTVLAQGLANPRGMVIGPDGALYVALAGSGGDGPCRPSPEGTGDECYGETGSIIRITDSGVEVVVDGLPSLAVAGAAAIGVQDITFMDDDLFAIIGWGGDPDARDDLGDVGDRFGWLVEIEADGDVERIVDIAEHEASKNPDGGHVDSNPFSLVADDDEFYVVDAGGNSFLEVEADLDVETVAVFPDVLASTPPTPTDAVPTYVRLGPDGDFYIGQLTGFPFPKGLASVWRVDPGDPPAIVASGFTNIMGVAFGPDDSLYVLEMAHEGLASGDVTSALYRIAPDGTRTRIITQGLAAATGLAVGPDGTIYVSNLGVVPNGGEVVQIRP